jgi:hypothetical protein
MTGDLRSGTVTIACPGGDVIEEEVGDMHTSARWALGGLALAGVPMLFRPGTRANKLVCREFDQADRRLRYRRGHVRAPATG